ncbi:response regulator [Methanobacterium oryzae]|uniref:response regulator n=1 Tax=Methanobacterium oryzae TaxID=69540 RepID=UPI003D212C5E
MNELIGKEILLIEDNPSEARLIIEVFDGFKIRNNITIVTDGAEAMDYLYKKGDYADRKCPSLIILDLNLPKKDGREILKEIKHDENLKIIPVVVLTTSSDEGDVKMAYSNYASAFLTKPSELHELVDLVKLFEGFWFKWATLLECD